ncbi:MAG: Minf_1886 family protein [candidate division WOR-3 bacterium]
MILLYDLLKNDPRYSLDAYLLINDGLQLAYQQTGRNLNITARELLAAIRQIVVDRYGLLASVVLKSWGISSGADIGQLVANLVNAGLLRIETINPQENFAVELDLQPPSPPPR